MSIDTLETRETRETAEHDREHQHEREHVLTRGPLVLPPSPCAHHVAPACGHHVPAEDDLALALAVVRPALLAGEEHESPDPWIFRGTD
ncbi:hypothetical protein ABZ135_35630 [Streptomyces sp. NPDC006339]|uniref:hypothetical protein n=1 Tax=Streptomyces sp. NPDC006339 TaxID=3156755 RepID=UPI0033AC620D